MAQILVTSYLEMTDFAEFKPAILKDLLGVAIFPLETPDIQFYRFLYREVGKAWRWRDRLLLSDGELTDILANAGTTIDVLYVNGAPAGYIELSQCGVSTEIVYLGLRPDYL